MITGKPIKTHRYSAGFTMDAVSLNTKPHRYWGERRFAERIAYPYPPTKAGGFPPTYGVGGGAMRRKNRARFASPLGSSRNFGVSRTVSDQRERGFGNRAVARTGIQRPNVGPPTYGVGGGAFAPENFAA